jgi:hypothetical protein
VAAVGEQQRSNASEQVAIENKRSQARHNVQSANNDRKKAFIGCGIGMILAAIVSPILLPVVCCIGRDAADAADDRRGREWAGPLPRV